VPAPAAAGPAPAGPPAPDEGAIDALAAELERLSAEEIEMLLGATRA
jgi:hypothetical protein